MKDRTGAVEEEEDGHTNFGVEMSWDHAGIGGESFGWQQTLFFGGFQKGKMQDAVGWTGGAFNYPTLAEAGTPKRAPVLL